jgi:riboflavin biosynthesis pyrimidine reductase
VLGAFLYVQHLRSARDAALVQVATLQATNNELTAVHENDVKALADLAAAKVAAEAALTEDAARQRAVADTVIQRKE